MLEYRCRSTTRIRSLAVMVVLWGAGCLADAGAPAAATVRPRIAAADLHVLGVALHPAPTTQLVPLGIPTVVHATLTTGGDPGAPIAVVNLPASYRVHAELSGPGLARPLAIECPAGGDLPIPALAVAGHYRVENIRLMDGVSLLFTGTPAAVDLQVENILVTRVSSRILTLEEIQARGIVLDESSFQVLDFTVTLGFSTGEIQLHFPALLPPQGGPPMFLPHLSLPQEIGPLADAPASASAPGMMAQGFVPRVQDESDHVEIPVPGLSGVLVFPQSVGFLNQFHSVILEVGNGAPGGSPITLRDLTARFTSPNGRLGQTASTPPTGPGAPVPVRSVGPDGRCGTADDALDIAAGQTGMAEAVVTGREEGLHRIDVAIEGRVGGLPGGEARMVGSVAGSVLIRNPRFNLSFLLPGVIEEGREFALTTTLTNSGTTAANLASLRLPSARLSGATLLPSESELRVFDVIEPGESAAAIYRLRALRTGRVTTSRFSSPSANLEGRFEFAVAVGDEGVPLSPDVVTLPAAAHLLPADLMAAMLPFLGTAWSNATAPAGSLPPGMAQVPISAVHRLSAQLADAGQRLELGEPLESVLGHLLLRLGAGEAGDLSLDALRRRSSGWPLVAQAFSRALASLPGAPHASDLARSIATRHLHEAPLLLAALDADTDDALHLELVADSGARLGGEITVREIPTGEHLAIDARRTLALVTRPAGRHQMTVRAVRATTARVTVVVPMENGPGDAELHLLEFTGLAFAAGDIATLAMEPGILPSLITPGGRQIAPTRATQLQPPALAIESAGVAAAFDAGRHVLAVRFNRPVAADSATDLAGWSLLGEAMAGQAVTGITLQASGRIALLRLRNPVPPTPPALLEVRGLRDRDGGDIGAPAQVAIHSPAMDEWGTVSGLARDGRGQPLANLALALIESIPATVGGGFARVQTAQAVTDGGGRFRFWFARRTGRPLEVAGVDSRTLDRGSTLATLRNKHEDLAIELRFSGRGDLTGRVVSPAGVPIGRVLVTGEATLSHGFVQAWSAADGRFRLDGVAVGAINLSFKDRDGRFAARTALVPRAGSNVDLGDVVLGDVPLGTVRGRVLENGQPVAGAPVMVSSSGTQPAWGAWKFTSVDGTFEFAEVPAGDITITGLDAADYSWQRARASARLEANRSLDFGLTFTGGSGRINGHLLDPLGRPVAGAGVELRGAPGTTATNADGYFEFPSVALGSGSVATVDGAVSAAYSLYWDGQVQSLVLRLPAFGAIAVTVRDAFGQPAGGIEVWIRNTPYRCQTRLPGGQCRLASVPLGAHAVLARTTTPAGGDPRDAAFTSTETAVRFVGETATANLNFPASSRLMGRVLDPDGRRLDGAEVSLWSMRIGDDGEPEFMATTPPQATIGGGVFEFQQVRQGPFLVLARHPLFATRTEISGNLSGDRVIELQLPRENPAASLMVHTVMPDGTVPDARFPIELSLTPLEPLEPPLTAQGQDHVFSVSGRFHLTARYDNGSDLYAASLVGFAAGDQTVEVRLLGFGEVAAVVRDGNGAPVPGARVHLRASGLPDLVQERDATTDLDGRCRFSAVREGVISLHATHLSEQGQAAGVLTHDTTLERNIGFAPLGVIDGRVLAPDGKTPIAGATVSLARPDSSDWEILDATVSDGDGRYRLGPVPYDPVAGQYYLAVATDLESGRRAQEALLLRTETAGLDLRLRGRGGVHGVILDSDGLTPVGNASIELSQGPSSAALPGLTLRTRSDPDSGRYVLDGVGEGAFSITAALPASALRARATGDVGDGESVALDLRLEGHGQVVGIVTRDGRPFAGATVRLLGEHGQQEMVSGVDPGLPAGGFAFTRVALGDFRVSVTTNDLDFGSWHGRLSEDRAVASGEITLAGFAEVIVTVKGATPERYAIELQHAVTESRTAATNMPVSFARVRRGALTLKASNDALTSFAAGSATLAADMSSLALELLASPVVAVSGQVHEPGGTPPLESAAVLELTSGSFSMAQPLTAGRFRFASVPAIPGESLELRVIETWGTGRARHRAAPWSAIPADTVIDLTLDRTPARLVSAIPADGATAVELPLTVLQLHFTETMDDVSLNRSLRLSCGGAPVPLRPVTVNGGRVTVAPAMALPGSRPCTLLVPATAEDDAGVAIGVDTPIRFQTWDRQRPTATLNAPVNGATGVPLDGEIRIGFSEPMDADSLRNGIELRRGAQRIAGITWVSNSGLEAGMNPALPPDSLLELTVDPAVVHDLSGNPILPALLSFRSADTIAPRVTAVSLDPIRTSHPQGSTVVAGARTAAGDEDTIRVDWFVDEVWHATGNPPDYLATVRVPSSPGPSFTLAARAIDAAGNIGPQFSLEVPTSADLPPSIRFLEPLDGQEFDLGGRIRVRVEASDDSQLAALSVAASGFSRVDRSLACVTSRCVLDFSFDAPEAWSGIGLTLSATANDSSGQSTTTAPLTVNLRETGAEGQVVDANGNPAAGVAVSVLAEGTGQNFGASTDANGRFRVGLAAGPYDRTYAENPLTGARLRDGRRFVAVTGKTVALGTLTLSGSGTVRGRVQVNGRAPVGGARVRLVNDWESRTWIATDPSGQFVLDRVAGGDFQVYARSASDLEVVLSASTPGDAEFDLQTRDLALPVPFIGLFRPTSAAADQPVPDFQILGRNFGLNAEIGINGRDWRAGSSNGPGDGRIGTALDAHPAGSVRIDVRNPDGGTASAWFRFDPKDFGPLAGTPAQPWEIRAWNNHLLVFGNDGLRIYRREAAKWSLLATLDRASSPRRAALTVTGDWIWLSRDEQLELVDMRVPERPVVRHTWSTADAISNLLAVSASEVWAVSSNRVERLLVDLSDPASPRITAAATLYLGAPVGVARLAGTRLWLTSPDDGRGGARPGSLRVFDVSDFSRPELLAERHGVYHGLAVAGRHAVTVHYGSGSGSKVELMEISTSGDLEVVASAPWTGSVWGVNDIQLSAGRAYFADGDPDHVVRAHDFTTAAHLPSEDIDGKSGRIRRLCFEGGDALLLSDTDVRHLQVADPPRPVLPLELLGGVAPLAGGSAFAVAGMDITRSDATRVRIDGVAVADTFVRDNEVVGVLPAHAEATATVTVEAPGQPPVTVPSPLEYTSAPRLFGLLPPRAGPRGGRPLRVDGINLNGQSLRIGTVTQPIVAGKVTSPAADVGNRHDISLGQARLPAAYSVSPHAFDLEREGPISRPLYRADGAAAGDGSTRIAAVEDTTELKLFRVDADGRIRDHRNYGALGYWGWGPERPELANGRLYVVMNVPGFAGIRVLDSDAVPVPATLGEIRDPRWGGDGNPGVIRVQGNLLFTSRQGCAYDISDPARVAALGCIGRDLGNYSTDGRWLYETAGVRLEIFDFNAPLTPTLSSSTVLPAAGRVAVQGDLLVLAGTSNQVWTLDISDRSSPVVHGPFAHATGIETRPEVDPVWIAGNVLIAARNDGDFWQAFTLSGAHDLVRGERLGVRFSGKPGAAEISGGTSVGDRLLSWYREGRAWMIDPP